MAAVACAKARSSEAGDVVLQAIGGPILDHLAVKAGAALHVQLERAALLREN